MISLVNIPCILIRFTFYSNDNVRRKKWAEMRCAGRGGNVISCFVCLTSSGKIFVLELILCSIIFLKVPRDTASLRTYPSLSFPMAIYHVNYPRLVPSGLIAYSVPATVNISEGRRFKSHRIKKIFSFHRVVPYM